MAPVGIGMVGSGFMGLTYSEAADYLVLDAATIRNLELLESSGGDSKDTLLSVINKTSTSMGAR